MSQDMNNPYTPQPPQSPNDDYTVFGGWLLVFYWFAIVGGVLTLLTMVLPALITIATSFLIGFIYATGTLISIVASCVSAVFYIKFAVDMKARKPQFIDNYIFGMLIVFGGNILSSLLRIRSAYGIGSFISSTVGSVLGLAIGLCLLFMYFSKSVRVNTYFGGRPLKNSRFWNWIKILPPFIISDSMPTPDSVQQTFNAQTPPPAQAPPSQTPPPAQAPPSQTPPPAQAQSAFCGECGTANEVGKKFCGNCGKPL